MVEKIAMGLAEAAEAVGLSPWTLRKMIARGRLPVVRINRKILVEHDVLKALVKDHRSGHKTVGSD